MKIHISLFMLLLSLQIAVAKSNIETSGDILAVLIPGVAYGATLYHHDQKAQNEFYKSYAATLGITYALKYTIREKRPESSERNSFPSGHTSSAFSGAAFIHKKYGLKYALVPYLAAVYTGYSRVYAHKHYIHDVIAGALVGVVSGWYFATPYKNLKIIPSIGGRKKRLGIVYLF